MVCHKELYLSCFDVKRSQGTAVIRMYRFAERDHVILERNTIGASNSGVKSKPVQIIMNSNGQSEICSKRRDEN